MVPLAVMDVKDFSEEVFERIINIVVGQYKYQLNIIQKCFFLNGAVLPQDFTSDIRMVSVLILNWKNPHTNPY